MGSMDTNTNSVFALADLGDKQNNQYEYGFADFYLFYGSAQLSNSLDVTHGRINNVLYFTFAYSPLTLERPGSVRT